MLPNLLDERLQPPYSLPHSRPDFTKANPKAGAIQLTFNSTGSLLLARFESSPTAVFLFSFPTLAEADQPSTSPRVNVPKLRSVLLHTKPITAARWNPVRKGSLAVCSGSGGLYLWSDEWVGEGLDSSGTEGEEVAECVGVPASKTTPHAFLFPRLTAAMIEQFETRDLKWSPDGKGLVLLDRETFCCAFEIEEQDTDGVQ